MEIGKVGIHIKTPYTTGEIYDKLKGKGYQVMLKQYEDGNKLEIYNTNNKIELLMKLKGEYDDMIHYEIYAKDLEEIQKTIKVFESI